MIELNFTKRLGKFHLTADLSDDGFIEVTGPNGSGKTSLLRCISGYLQVDSGTIKIDGRDITGLGIPERHVIYVSHESFLPSLTVSEHLQWPLRNKTDGKIVQELREKLGINYDGKVQDLSLGQKLRVSIATAVASKPSALLFDEILQNISEGETFKKALGKFCRQNGITIVSVSQETGNSGFFQHKYSIENGVLVRIE